MEGEGRGKGGEGDGREGMGACAVLTFPLKNPCYVHVLFALLTEENEKCEM